MSEYNKRGVVLDHNFPVMPIILMVFALICRFIPLSANIGYQGFFSYLYFISMVLMFFGIVLHRANMQILSGIGTLVIAAYNFYLVIDRVSYISLYGFEFDSLFNIFVYALALAAFTVTGLHYVLRRPKPGKSAKLILMIPLTCFWIIQVIVQIISLAAASSSFSPVLLLLNCLANILMAFALMVYTPFREA